MNYTVLLVHCFGPFQEAKVDFYRREVKKHTHVTQYQIVLATGHGKAWNNCFRALPHVGVLDNCPLWY